VTCGSLMLIDLQAYTVHMADKKLKNNTVQNFCSVSFKSVSTSVYCYLENLIHSHMYVYLTLQSHTRSYITHVVLATSFGFENEPP
jgi:hypothetical protein